jgi:hypothetical protein
MVDFDLTSWPRVRRLCLAKVSRWGIWSSLWLPGMYFMDLFAAVASVKATHAVTTSGLLGPNRSSPGARLDSDPSGLMSQRRGSADSSHSRDRDRIGNFDPKRSSGSVPGRALRCA